MKRIFFFPLLLFLVGGTILNSCRKGVLVDPKTPPGNTQGNPDIYVAVNENSRQGYYYDQGKYYKNGMLVTLPNSSFVFSITVSGNDVYVSGLDATGVPAYWKNESEVGILNYTNHSIITGALIVSGKDVYIPITEFNYDPRIDEDTFLVATYWKNNTQVTLSDSLTLNEATSIAISERGTYVTGYEIRYDGGTRAKYWLNGTPVYLSGDGKENASANLIVISGNDVYIGGIIYRTYNGAGVPRIVYWKNGTLVYVTDGTDPDVIKSMAVSGTDVYLAGTEYHQLNPQSSLSKSTALYWKNGTPVVLSTSPFDSGANAIAVDGQDVYVAGFESEGTRKIARYWKNGIPAFVSNSPFDSEAFSICLSK